MSPLETYNVPFCIMNSMQNVPTWIILSFQDVHFFLEKKTVILN